MHLSFLPPSGEDAVGKGLGVLEEEKKVEAGMPSSDRAGDQKASLHIKIETKSTMWGVRGGISVNGLGSLLS